MRDHIFQLGGFAGIGNQQAEILRANHPKITMAGFGCVDEIGGCAGAGKCGRNFAPDMARFPDA